MAKVYELNCREVAGIECEFSTRRSTVEDVIEACADHGRSEHGMMSFSPDLFLKMRGCVHEIDEEPAQ